MWTANNKITSNCERSPVSAAEPLGPDQSLPVACVNISLVLISKIINIVFSYLDQNQCLNYIHKIIITIYLLHFLYMGTKLLFIYF